MDGYLVCLNVVGIATGDSPLLTGAEIEKFNMHLQRLKSNQVNIPDSVAGMMVLLALPAKWNHVSAIYLQNKTAIRQVSLSEVHQAIVAEFD